MPFRLACFCTCTGNAISLAYKNTDFLPRTTGLGLLLGWELARQMLCFYYFHAPFVWEALFLLPEPCCLWGAGAAEGSAGAGWAMALAGQAPDAGPPTVTPLQMKMKSLSSG